MTTDRTTPAGRASRLERHVGRLLLRCPKCRKEMHVDRESTDYPEAVRIEVTCPDCNAGDFAEVMQFDAEGRHIIRDPDESPNAEVSGAGTASAGLPGYAPTNDGERK